MPSVKLCNSLIKQLFQEYHVPSHPIMLGPFVFFGKQRRISADPGGEETLGIILAAENSLSEPTGLKSMNADI